MAYAFLIVGLLIALPGVYFVADFLVWQFRGHVVPGTLLGFKKEGGASVPVVSFTVREGEEVKAKIARVDQFLFFLNGPGKGDPTTVIYKRDTPKRARIYGYIYLVIGVVLCLPLFFAVANVVQANAALVQLSYVLIFGVVSIGGWIVLKLIQKYY